MKLFFSVGVLLICFQLKAQKPVLYDNDTIISWSKTRVLQWDDFTGKTDPNIYAYALTSHKIELLPVNLLVDQHNNIKNYRRLNVLVNFYKKKSWKFTEEKEVLIHERLHLDIAELFARKIRKAFSALKKANIANYDRYIETYTKLWQASRLYQKQYDEATNHGTKLLENVAWGEKIARELKSLQQFEYENYLK
ncbi:DUF922 domain-containing protein [Flavicella sediminum]|uniref:DUF922 domain-containing protein n=1 Tax=Flavicella sediminum TaxID=2585141 RepID=UPI00112039ED|nr:DUF922 domain-containing protein [Flavicella sediminum]